MKNLRGLWKPLAIAAALGLGVSACAPKDAGGDNGTGTGSNVTVTGCPEGTQWYQPSCVHDSGTWFTGPTLPYAGCWVECSGPQATCDDGVCTEVAVETLCPCPPWQGTCCSACGEWEMKWLCLTDSAGTGS